MIAPVDFLSLVSKSGILIPACLEMVYFANTNSCGTAFVQCTAYISVKEKADCRAVLKTGSDVDC
jgi:hypothetical protein